MLRFALQCSKINNANANARMSSSLLHCAHHKVVVKQRFFSFSTVMRDGGSGSGRRVYQELSLSEKARNIVEGRKSGALTTVSMDPEKAGMPLFGSVMPYVTQEGGKGFPVMALRVSEIHYQHLQQFDRASLLVYPLTPLQIAPTKVPIPKVNMTGPVKLIEDQSEVAQIRNLYEKRHPAAVQIMKEEGFKFFRLHPTEVYYVGGDSAQSDIISPEDYSNAKVDPVSAAALDIIPRVNKKYSGIMPEMCQEYGDTAVNRGSTFLFHVDRFGFNIMGVEKASNQWLNFRLPFPQEVSTPTECITALAASMEAVAQGRLEEFTEEDGLKF